jgi:hypothetical protein
MHVHINNDMVTTVKIASRGNRVQSHIVSGIAGLGYSHVHHHATAGAGSRY